jgi:hypothetical protein
LIPVEPFVQIRRTEAPELPDVRAANLSAPRQFLQCLMVDLQQVRSLLTVEQWFEFGNTEPVVNMRLDTDLSDLGTQSHFIRGMSHHFQFPAKPMRRQIYDATRDTMLL